MPRSNRKMKGGFWDSLTDAWDKTKKATGDAYSSATGSTTSYTPSSTSSSTPSSTSSSTTTYNTPTVSYTTPTTTYNTPTTSGGKSRKRSRKMRGGYSDNIALTGLAARASPISDIKSSQPLNIVGGKRRTKKCRRNRHGKSCKRRRR
jgi:hypothetical protein